MNHVGFGQSSFALNSLGLGLRLSTPVASGPKLQADFTTGTYTASGVTKTFTDLFTFNRAGKAWLVKDTGLQEYEADVPRIDDGLLIEQSATNYLSWSALQGTDVQNYPSSGMIVPSDDTILKTGEMYTYTRGYNVHSYKSHPKTGLNADIYVSRTDKQEVVLGRTTSDVNGYFTAVDDSTIKSKYNPATGLTVVSALLASTSGSLGLVKYSGQDLPDADLRSHAMQVTDDDYSSSLIVTSTVPVTRPADFLINKITGTTVTGDWDSTLTLSIVNGQLVHSGYGRIRSLEIN